MQDTLTQANDALTALQTALSDLNNESNVKSLGDQVLEAITPVLEAAGWTAPSTIPKENPGDTSNSTEQ